MLENNQSVDWAVLHQKRPYIIGEDIPWNGAVHQHMLDKSDTELVYVESIDRVSYLSNCFSPEEWTSTESPDLVIEKTPEDDPRKEILTDSTKTYKLHRDYKKAGELNRCELRDLPKKYEVIAIFDSFEPHAHSLVDWKRNVINLAEEDPSLFEKNQRLDNGRKKYHEMCKKLSSTTCGHEILEDMKRLDYSQQIKDPDFADFYSELSSSQQFYLDDLADDSDLELNDDLFTDL